MPGSSTRTPRGYTTDQRGLLRPVDAGSDADTVAQPDIGAFEAHAAPQLLSDQRLRGNEVTVRLQLGNAPGLDVKVSADPVVRWQVSGSELILTAAPSTDMRIPVTVTVTDSTGKASQEVSFNLDGCCPGPRWSPTTAAPPP